MFRVVTHPEAAEQLGELPSHLLADYACVLDAIAAAPWDGAPHDADKPDAQVRRRLFGPLGVAQVLYLVLDREREVHVLRVVWLELPD